MNKSQEGASRVHITNVTGNLIHREDFGPSFGRRLADTIIDYLKWGYGALNLSFALFGIYRLALFQDSKIWFSISASALFEIEPGLLSKSEPPLF
jgi:hypothetical protein